MYRTIAGHPTTQEIYDRELIDQGIVTAEEVEGMRRWFHIRLEADYRVDKAEWPEGKWEGLKTLAGEEEMHEYDTAVSPDRLREVGLAIARPPGDFRVHPRLLRLLETLMEGGDVDWAMAEALALGTLLAEGIPVRLSGQDSGRGRSRSAMRCWSTRTSNTDMSRSTTLAITRPASK